MIPKIIHYCWFGSKEIPADLQEYINGWKKYFPDYTLKLWNETSIPKDAIFLKLMIKYKKWALVADYVRLYALYHEGGLYFDTDIEIIKPFDDLLKEKCFIGFQHRSVGRIMLNAAVIGTEPGHLYIKECFRHLTWSYYNRLKPLLIPRVSSEVALKMGVTEYKEQYIGTTLLLPVEAFYPYAWDEQFYPECVKENTYTIHHWQYSWKRKRGLGGLLKSLSFKAERRLFMLKHQWAGTYKKFEESV